MVTTNKILGYFYKDVTMLQQGTQPSPRKSAIAIMYVS